MDRIVITGKNNGPVAAVLFQQEIKGTRSLALGS